MTAFDPNEKEKTNEQADKTGKEKKAPKEKRRLFDETGKRLVREIRPLRGWILLSALLCLLLIGCAVAKPELLGGLIDKMYEWAKAPAPGLAKSLMLGWGCFWESMPCRGR